MKNANMQTLKDLLERALPSVQICSRALGGGMVTKNIEKYKYLFRKNRNYVSAERLNRSVYFPGLQDDAARKHLLNFIRDELSGYMLDDNMLVSRHGLNSRSGGSWSCASILAALLRVALLKGSTEAARSFYKPIVDEWIPFQYMMLIDGMKVDCEMHLYDGVRISPLPSSISDLPDYLPIDNYWGGDESARKFCSKTIISVDCFAPITFRAKNESPETWLLPKVASKDLKNLNLHDRCAYIDHFYDFFLFLSLTCNHAVQSVVEWNYYDVYEVFVDIYSSSHSGPGSVKNRSSVTVTEDQVIEAKSLHNQFLSINSKTRKALEIALSRWREAKSRTSSVDKMIDLGIAFESIYLDAGNTEQLALAFRVRAAWFLGGDATDREHLLRTFNAIYDFRSQAVHRGRLSDTVKIGNEPTPQHEFLVMAENLCAESIKKIIQHGEFPDWNKLITGGDLQYRTR